MRILLDLIRYNTSIVITLLLLKWLVYIFVFTFTQSFLLINTTGPTVMRQRPQWCAGMKVHDAVTKRMYPIKLWMELWFHCLCDIWIEPDCFISLFRTPAERAICLCACRFLWGSRRQHTHTHTQITLKEEAEVFKVPQNIKKYKVGQHFGFYKEGGNFIVFRAAIMYTGSMTDLSIHQFQLHAFIDLFAMKTLIWLSAAYVFVRHASTHSG